MPDHALVECVDGADGGAVIARLRSGLLIRDAFTEVVDHRLIVALDQ